MSLDEQQENNISNFFANKLAEQQDPGSRPLNRNIGSLHTEKDQDQANISNFFTKKLAEQETNVNKPRASVSPLKKHKGDPRSIYSRKDLSEREKEQLFLQYYDDTIKLRTNQTKLEQHIKELKTKLRVIEGEYVYSKKKFQGDEIVKEDLAFIEEIKRENQLLKNQMKGNTLPKTQLPSTKQKVIVKSTPMKVAGTPHKASPDHIRLIDQLKIQLKKAEQEIQSLHHQMATRGAGGQNSDFHDKNVKIATLQHRYENIDSAFGSQKVQLEKTKQMMEEINKQLYQEKARNSQLEVQMRSLELAAATAKDLQLQVEEVEREKKMLEAKYKDLVESPFFKDIGEKAANPARLREAETQLTELKNQLKTVHDQNTANEKQVVELKSQVKLLTLEKDKLKDEKTRMEAIMQERERTQGFMDKQMEMFNMGNDREKDNFIKALGMVRLKGEEPAWKRLEFIERHEELDITNPTSLLREIDRLRLEKSEIAAQLEKAQTLLQTHIEMEKEKEIINNAELNKLQLQLKSANNRIEELVKLADFRARTYKDNMLKSGLGFKPYDEGASEFSDITESEISTNENTMDVLVRGCELDELVLRKLLSGKVMDLEGLQTMVALDFYNHDTQNSEVTEGLKPNYNFQVAYRVNVNEELINYMENEFLRAEIYAVIGSDLTLIGTCYTSYRELLIKNYDAHFGTSAVVNLNSIVYGERKSDIIGVLKIKLRMRHPISDALHWIKERAEFMRENQETLETRMDPTLKSRKLIVQVDKVSGLDKRAASFVYYKLYNLRDTSTPTVPGQEPVFNYISTHDLLQNEAVKKYLEKEYLEFVVFDDTAPLRRTEGRTTTAALEGMIGRGRVKLNPLLHNEPIDQVIPIQNLRGGRVGALHVRMYWYDQNAQTGYANDTTNLTQVWEENMTRNIVSTWKMKGQNLDSAFSILDADGDGRLSFEEFKDGILRTFKIKAKEDEVGLYWRRLHLVNEYLPKDEFFLKFGPYFSGEDNLRVTYNKLDNIRENEYRDKISQINQMLNKNTETISNQVATNHEIVNLMCRRLAQHIKQYNLPIDFYLSKFDRDSSGYISKPEMRAGLASLEISLTEKEIDDLLRYFDVNQDNRISLEEFKTLVRGGIADELRKLRNQEVARSESIGPEAREEVIKFIATHITKSKKTIQQFTKGLDADGSGTISRNEFSKFFQNIGMTLQKRELDALFEELDPKITDKVSVKRFNEVVGRYIDERPVMTTSIEKSLGAIGAYIKEKNLDAHAYFNKIDKDKSGFLDRKELKAELQDKGIVSSDIEMENLLDYFDNNKDGRINSREFVNAIQPYINLARAQSQRQTKEVPNNKIVNDLKGKCHEIIRKNYQTLLTSFNLFKENLPGSPLVSKDNFRNVFIQFNLGFLPSEIDLILEYLVDTNADGLVYYEKFLNNYNDSTFDKHVDFAESRTLSSAGFGGDRSYKRLSSAEEIFGRINKVLKDNRISPKEAFGVFDKDGNGKISLQEFRDAFAGMKLSLTKQEIEDLIRHIDKGKDGQINYNEFIAALKI